MKKTALMLLGVLVLPLSSIAPPALAQDNYPSSAVRLVVPFLPGATTDMIGRLLAQRLSAQMNATVLVENKAGAGGNVGAAFVSNSRPDGYMLLVNTTGVIFSRVLGEKLEYDVLKDLAPVALVATVPQLFYVNPSVPVNTVAEFITYLKANPDKLAYGSGGTGAITHLGPLLFLQANGLTALHVPYKGASEATIDLVAGRIQFAMQSSMVAVLPLVNDKRVKVLAITGLKRSPLLPDVPTLAETMPGFEVGSWFGVMAPAKTPPAIVKRLNSEIVKALQDPDVRSRLARENAEPLGSTPEEYGAYLKSELERWTRIIKSAGVKLE